MSVGTFWKGLAGVILLTAIVLWAIDMLVPAAEALGLLSLITSVVFTSILIAAYYLAGKAVRSPSKSLFIQLVMMIIIAKMFVCVLIVAVYIKIAAPESKLFVLPFLTIYVIFTIFEVIVLERIARAETTNRVDRST